MKQSFGKKDGQEVYLYTLENENVRFSVTDYGATLVSLTDRETGLDVVLGFDDVSGYIEHQGFYMGASIGRTANRIEKGQLNLNGRTYQLYINNNGNCNHGGKEGFDQKIFDAEEKEDRIIFTRLSPDGEENYPGSLAVKISYILLENGVAIEAEGTSDQDTVFAYTSHSYFNPNCSESALNVKVKINAERYGLSDANGLMTNELKPVEGTPFDFREYKEMGRDVDADDEQIRLGAGYDHYFDITGEGFREMASLCGEKLKVTISSDMPGMHMYSANYLDGALGKYGNHYDRRAGIAMEAEYFPNAVNYEGHKKPIVHAGETMKHRISFTLSRI